MAAKKAKAKRSRRRAHRIEPWDPSDIAPGTITVTFSTVHLQRMFRNLAKGLEDPAKVIALRDGLNQIIEQHLQQRGSKKKSKKKPDPDQGLN